ncbi:MAG: carbohydrate binding domain-containing protein [Armatimonadota bacterium]
MNRLAAGTVAVILAVLLASAACAETYTVDGVRGDDANDGVAAPFRTISRGTAAVGPGDTLVIVPMDEPYRETLALRRHGLPRAPIVIEGGGSVLCGSDPAPTEGWVEGEGGIWSVPLASHERMMVFGPERHFLRGRSAAELQPEQWFWAEGTFYFRPAEGGHPNDYGLLLATTPGRSSGVAVSGAGWIIVRDLTCVNFWNDGFNLHGGTGPIWFENITGNWNGDEGFSAHENSECYVRGGEFSHNYWHGIADIIFSRTHFSGIVCRDNRAAGVLFLGGMHSLTDCEISGSPINIGLKGRSETPFPLADQHPLTVSVTNLRNVVVRSTDGEVGVQVAAQAQCVIEHCLLEGGNPVIEVQEGGTAFVADSVVAGGAEREVVAAGSYVADHNLYFPGRFLIGDVEYGAEQFADYRAATGNDAHSVIGEPILDESRAHLAPGSPGWAGADSGSYGGISIGPEDRTQVVSVAVAGVPVLSTAGEPLEGGGRRFTYDFEADNPWARVYPQPEQSPAGLSVQAASALSEEQAHTGAKSAKLHVVTPPAPPAAYTIKLFSLYLPFDRPVRRISYWLYGDGSGRTARLRIRDGGGESFYGPQVTVDWTGWRQVAWDLDATPPALIGGGDGNRLQDGPTMEVVVDISMEAAGELTLYFDDLQIELAP